MKAIKDIYGVTQSLAPAANTSTPTATSVDLANVQENEFVFAAGVRTDGTHTPKLQESNDNSTWTDVAAANMVGTLAAITSNSVQRVSYIGSMRYVLPVVTVSGASTGAIYSAIAITKKRKQP